MDETAACGVQPAVIKNGMNHAENTAEASILIQEKHT